MTAGAWPVARADGSVAHVRFAAGASVRNCDGRCCRCGVSVDLAERDRILAQTTPVREAMDEGQLRDPETWFDPQPRADADFPSGRAVRTAVRHEACVFRDARGRCVLHALRDAAGVRLKPFRCRAYPLIVERGIALVDPDAVLRPLACCGTAAGGPSNVLDVCPDEVTLVLGPDGAADLRRRIGG